MLRCCLTTPAFAAPALHIFSKQSLSPFPCPDSIIFSLLLLMRASFDNCFFPAKRCSSTADSGSGKYECQHQQLYGGEKGEHRRGSTIHGDEGELNF